jgi:lysophospholipid acyltransferase (LPLAT)-like uncharacterized protein
MKLRHPGLIRLAALGVAALIRLWVGTLRIRGRFEDGMVHSRDPGRQRFIYAFWHESLLIPTVVRTPVYIRVGRPARTR